jgi:serine phosphatase RsbU (regulator of sigma subunit)
MPAALLMAKLSAEARFCMWANHDIAKAVGRLNEHLLQAGMMDRFVTLSACLVNPINHTVTVANAGHISPLVFRKATGKLEDAISNKSTGFPLGMIEGTEYECNTIQLEPGDCVIVFTDGVTDALNLQNEPFGNERVRQAILEDTNRNADSNTPQLIGKRIIAAVQLHSHGQFQADDIALVCFGRLEDASAQGTESGRISTATGPITQTLKRIPGRDD